MNRQQTDIKDVIDGWTLCVWLRGRNMKPKGKSWLQSSKDGLDAQVWHGAWGLWFCGVRIRFPTCLCGCWSCQSWGCKVLYQAAYLLPNRLSAREDRSADVWRNHSTTLTACTLCALGKTPLVWLDLSRRDMSKILQDNVLQRSWFTMEPRYMKEICKGFVRPNATIKKKISLRSRDS